jgi:hypothetical protein
MLGILCDTGSGHTEKLQQMIVKWNKIKSSDYSGVTVSLLTFIGKQVTIM